MAVSGGWGVDLQIEVSSTLTTIVNGVELEFPSIELELTDVTAHDSTGGWQERLATGRLMSGEFKAKMTWDDSETTHQQIHTDQAAKTASSMAIISPDDSETYTFSAFVKSIKPVSPQNGSYDMEVTFAPTGAIVRT